MQILSAIFSLLSVLPNKFIPYLQIINGIFDFSLNQNKIIMKKNSIKDFNSMSFLKNSSFVCYHSSKTKIHKIINNNASKNSGNDNSENSSIVNIFGKKRISSIINNKNDGSKIFFINNNHNKRNSVNFFNYNFNQIHNKMEQKQKEKQKEKYIHRVGSFHPNKLESIKERKEKDENDIDSLKNSGILKDLSDGIKINFFQYYCFKRITKKRKEIEMFEAGFSLFKKRMDIINVFSLLFFAEKNCLKLENEKL